VKTAENRHFSLSIKYCLSEVRKWGRENLLAISMAWFECCGRPSVRGALSSGLAEPASQPQGKSDREQDNDPYVEARDQSDDECDERGDDDDHDRAMYAKIDPTPQPAHTPIKMANIGRIRLSIFYFLMTREVAVRPWRAIVAARD
jgi:hypothetical protein